MKVLKRSLLFCFCIGMMSSCVSKKVFNDMQMSRDAVQKQLANMKKENLSLKTDFDLMKADMLASNAQKDTEIAQAQAALKKEQTQVASLKKDLENMSDLYSSQKNYGSSRNQELAQLRKTLEDLRTKNSSLEYSLKMTQDRADNSNQELANVRKSIADQGASVRQYEQEIETQKKQIALLNAQIMQSKQTLESLSTQFVALRKDMLRAQTAGNAIDPNSNENINSIAKSLGLD